MELTHFDAARRELEIASTVDEVMDIRDKAAALQAYVKQAGESRDMQNQVAEIKLRAERKAGELIQAGQEKGEIAGKGRPEKTTTVGDLKPRPLSDFGINHNQSSRFQAIANIPENKFEKYVTEQKESEVGEVTSAGALRLAKMVSSTGMELDALMSSESNEWYTTKDIIRAVVDVMGAIDLDPCSNSHEDPNVPALHHFTKDDDGLSKEWFGRVYVNPPYGRAIPEWVQKLVDEYAAKRISQAVLLLPARPDTRWFRMLRPFPRRFMFGRVRFNDHENSAPFPTMLVNIGCDWQRFNEVMGDLGDIYECVHTTSTTN